MGGGTMHSERTMDTRATQVGARMRMRAPHPYSSEPGTRTRGCAKVLERRLRSREEDARGGCVLEARAALAQCSPSAILDAGASSFRNSRDLLLRRARSVKTSNANCRFSVFSLSLPSFFVQQDLFRPLVIDCADSSLSSSFFFLLQVIFKNCAQRRRGGSVRGRGNEKRVSDTW